MIFIKRGCVFCVLCEHICCCCMNCVLRIALFANLGVSQVQQGAQLFGVKLNFDFLVARGAELLLNEVDNGTHLVDVFDIVVHPFVFMLLHMFDLMLMLMVMVLTMIVVFVFQNPNGHDIIAYGLGDKLFLVLFTRTKRGVVIMQQYAQIGCVCVMRFKRMLMRINAKVVLDNLYERAQIARIQMGFRNHERCT